MMMVRARHPEREMLIDAAEDPARLDEALRDHLDACPRCAGAFTRIGRLIRALSLIREAPPASSVELALARISESAAAGRGPGLAELLSDLIGRLHGGAVGGATLVSDSLTPSPAVRGSTQAAPRLLVYETPRYSISLTLQDSPQSGETDLFGQIAPRGTPELPEGGRAFLACGDAIRESTLSAFGEFSFETLPGTVDRLILEIGGEAISVGPLPAPIEP